MVLGPFQSRLGRGSELETLPQPSLSPACGKGLPHCGLYALGNTACSTQASLVGKEMCSRNKSHLGTLHAEYRPQWYKKTLCQNLGWQQNQSCRNCPVPREVLCLCFLNKPYILVTCHINFRKYFQDETWLAKYHVCLIHSLRKKVGFSQNSPN